MKNVLLAILLSVSSASAFAADATGEVGVVSDFIYRGQTETAGEPAVYGELKVSGIVFDGDYIRGETLVTDLDDAYDMGRSEVGVGYAKQFGKLGLDASFNRVINSSVYPVDFNEVRLTVDYGFTDNFTLGATAAQITSDAVSEDLYLELAATYDNLFVDGLSARLATGTFHQDATTDFRLNNVELGLQYSLSEKVAVFGTYSVGGKTVADAIEGEVSVRSNDIPSIGMVGVKYTF